MKISKEVRLLQNKWSARTGWVWAADCFSESDAEKFIKPIREELLKQH